MAVGTDAGTPFNAYDRTAFEAVLMVENGMTPAQAVRCATLSSARLLGVSDTHGTIEPGKTANFAIFDANPLEDIHALLHCSMTVLRGEILRF